MVHGLRRGRAVGQIVFVLIHAREVWISFQEVFFHG